MTEDVGSGNKRVVLVHLGIRDDCGVAVMYSLISKRALLGCFYMHGKSAPLQEIRSDSVSPILTSASAVSGLIGYMDGCSICCGNLDEKFLPLVEARKGKIVDASGINFFNIKWCNKLFPLKLQGSGCLP